MNKNRWVDLSSLPTREFRRKTLVDWEQLNADPIPFQYDDTKGILQATYKYKDKNNIVYLDISYQGIEQVITVSNLKKASLKRLTGTYAQFYSIGDTVEKLQILDLIRTNTKQQGYKILCLETNEVFERSHVDLKINKISPYITGRKVWEGNSLYNESGLLPFLKNPEDAKKYTRGSQYFIECKCPNCGKEKELRVYSLVTQGFVCSYCTTGMRYPERLMLSLFEMNGIEVETQKKYTALGNLRMDFYIPSLDWVVETHGAQHYRPQNDTSSWYGAYEKTVASDTRKKEYCVRHGIKYTEVNCLKSELSYILSSIEEHEELDRLLINKDINELQLKMVEKSNYKYIKEILRDKELGLSDSNIGKKYDYSRVHIYQIIKKYKEDDYNSK